MVEQAMGSARFSWCGLRAWPVALVALAMSAGATARASEIAVSPQIVVFENGQPSEQRVIVANSGADTGYVTVEPRLVRTPGEQNETLQVIADPAILGIAAAPTRMVLEASERRSLRLLALNPPGAADRVWRVKVAPAVGRLKPGQAGLSFTVAFDLLVIQRAANARSAVSGDRVGATLRLTNTGNSFALVTKAQACPRSGACRDLSLPRLYAGRTVEIAVGDATAPVTVEITQADGRVTRQSY